jgi:hypothetical protein
MYAGTLPAVCALDGALGPAGVRGLTLLLPPQVAKTMAPSVIYIDEVEKVFVSDKKKAKEFGGQVRS